MKTSVKKHSIKPGEFYVDPEKGTVVFAQNSKGLLYTGVANVDEHDKFDEERGKRIAMLRCDMQIRKRDAKNVKNAIFNLEKVREWSLDKRGFAGTDKIYTIALQKAHETLQLHYDAIRKIKKELRSYNGEE